LSPCITNIITYLPIQKINKINKSSPGVGGVDPREFEDFEFNKLSMFEDELVLLENKITKKI